MCDYLQQNTLKKISKQIQNFSGSPVVTETKEQQINFTLAWNIWLSLWMLQVLTMYCWSSTPPWGQDTSHVIIIMVMFFSLACRFLGGALASAPVSIYRRTIIYTTVYTFYASINLSSDQAYIPLKVWVAKTRWLMFRETLLFPSPLHIIF